MRGVLVALALTPIVTAFTVAARSPLEGWSGSAFEDYLGWMLLSLPFIVVLGAPVLVALLVLIRIGRPSRSLAIALAAVIGDGLFALLLTRPWDREPGLDTVVLAVLVYLPLWLTYGAIVRLPRVPRPRATGAHLIALADDRDGHRSRQEEIGHLQVIGVLKSRVVTVLLVAVTLSACGQAAVTQPTSGGGWTLLRAVTPSQIPEGVAIVPFGRDQLLASITVPGGGVGCAIPTFVGFDTAGSTVLGKISRSPTPSGETCAYTSATTYYLAVDRIALLAGITAIAISDDECHAPDNVCSAVPIPG